MAKSFRSDFSWKLIPYEKRLLDRFFEAPRRRNAARSPGRAVAPVLSRSECVVKFYPGTALSPSNFADAHTARKPLVSVLKPAAALGGFIGARRRAPQ